MGETDDKQLKSTAGERSGRTYDLGTEVMRRRFINGMLRWGHLHGGQKKAAIFAGYSEASASHIACQLMTKPEIAAEIIAEQQRINEKLGITNEKIMAGYAAVAFSDVADIMTWEDNKVTLKNLADLTPDESAMIASVTETKIRGGGTKLEVKTYDKLRALDALAKIKQLMKDPDQTPIGGVLRVPAPMGVEEWEAREGVSAIPPVVEPGDSDAEAEP